MTQQYIKYVFKKNHKYYSSFAKFLSFFVCQSELREFQFHKIRTQVMTRMTETEVQKFWSNKQLKKKDWLSLTSYLLSDLFSPEFMIPLQTVDTTFALKVIV